MLPSAANCRIAVRGGLDGDQPQAIHLLFDASAEARYFLLPHNIRRRAIQLYDETLRLFHAHRRRRQQGAIDAGACILRVSFRLRAQSRACLPLRPDLGEGFAQHRLAGILVILREDFFEVRRKFGRLCLCWFAAQVFERLCCGERVPRATEQESQC